MAPGMLSRIWEDVRDLGATEGSPMADMTSIPLPPGGRGEKNLSTSLNSRGASGAVNARATPKCNILQRSRLARPQVSQIKAGHNPSLAEEECEEIHKMRKSVGLTSSPRQTDTIAETERLSERGYKTRARIRSWRCTIPTTLREESSTGSAMTPCLSMTPAA
jgi:hypothetical protein